MNYDKYNKETNLSIAGRVVIVVISFTVMLMLGIAVGLYVFGSHPVIFGVSWVVLLVVIGFMMYYRGYVDQWNTIEMPWDAQTSSSRHMASPLLDAFVIKEIALAIVVSVFEIATLVNVKRKINRLNRSRVMELLSRLSNSAQQGKRFVPAVDYSEYCDELRVLLAGKIVWEKTGNGILLIGINRKYQKCS